ncbi:HPr family phosphocarrier protein [candidate division WOR-3 bacterium]|nr:HPr family phosphocarrier protein [candidate division WOR-3 bacterium]
MIEQQVKIRNCLGIHARPATLISQTAKKYKSKVLLVKDGFEVDAKSILDILLLEAPQGSVLTLKADGPDEKEAIEALRELIEERKFDEE